MYFNSIAKIVSERTGCDISTVKPESKFSELGMQEGLLSLMQMVQQRPTFVFIVKKTKQPFLVL